MRSSPVLDVKLECGSMNECERAVVRGDLQGFLVLPNELERRALRLETPVIPIYSSGQNYLTNMFATKEIRSVLSSVGSEMFVPEIADPVKTEIHSVGNVEGNYQGFLALGLVTAIFHLAAMIVGVYVLSFTVFGKEWTVRNALVELFPVMGMAIQTVGLRMRSAQRVRVAIVVSMPFWFTYNAVTFSVGGMLSDLATTASVIVGYLRYRKAAHNETEKTT